jgi:hypothetical protein
MGEHLSFIDGLLARLHGPMSFRFFIQPLIAIFFAFRDGRNDARQGRLPFFWALFTDSGHRVEMVQSGWKSIGKVFIIAMLLDGVFQYLVFRDFRPGGLLMAGLLLAIIPYLLFRGPVNRLMGRRAKREEP